MQRRLVLMRHAKSSWDDAVPTDHARPLNPRGRRDAPRMARWLVDQGWTPDAVYSSDAERTRETWERMLVAFEQLPPVQFEPQLYLAGLDTVRDLSRQWPDAPRTVLLLGHNPGWEQALLSLAGVDEHLPTGSCALLIGQGARWHDALLSPWRMEVLMRPRTLGE